MMAVCEKRRLPRGGAGRPAVSCRCRPVDKAKRAQCVDWCDERAGGRRRGAGDLALRAAHVGRHPVVPAWPLIRVRVATLRVWVNPKQG